MRAAKSEQKNAYLAREPITNTLMPVAEHVGKRRIFPTAPTKKFQANRWHQLLDDHYFGTMNHSPIPKKNRKNAESVTDAIEEFNDQIHVWRITHNRYDVGHANALIVDNPKKKIYLYEPHGIKAKDRYDFASDYQSVFKWVKRLINKELPRYSLSYNENFTQQETWEGIESPETGLCDMYSLIFAKNYLNNKSDEWLKMDPFNRWHTVRNTAEVLLKVGDERGQMSHWLYMHDMEDVLDENEETNIDIIMKSPKRRLTDEGFVTYEVFKENYSDGTPDEYAELIEREKRQRQF